MNNIKVSFSIKDLENLTGIKAHTIRIWEKRYGIIEPRRTNTNIRYYLEEDLKKIMNIALLNRNGYKISKIAKLQNNDIHSIAAKLTDVDKTFEKNAQTVKNSTPNEAKGEEHCS